MNHSKIKYLDGIRGIMAINVVINHFVMVFYPQMFFKEFVNDDVLSMFAYTPLSMFCNGNVAVQFFLVLTGFLVSRSMIINRNRNNGEILKKACNRYFRLMPVVSLAILFAFLTVVFGLQYQSNMVGVAKNGEYLQGYCNFEPTITSLIEDIFINTFFSLSKYVAPFWTIRYEFWGYIICLVTCYILKDSKWRRIGYVVVALLLGYNLGINYIQFLFGAFVADLVFENNKDATVLSRFYYNLINKKFFTVICTIFGLLLISVPTVNISDSILIIQIVEFAWLFRAMGWALLIFSTMRMKRTQRFFEMGLLQWIGKISFEVYALHWPIMLVVEMRLFAFFMERMGYNSAALLSFGIYLIVVIGAAYGLHLLMEKWNKSKFNLTKLLHLN